MPRHAASQEGHRVPVPFSLMEHRERGIVTGSNERQQLTRRQWLTIALEAVAILVFVVVVIVATA
jgi:hypothetical protein